MKAAFKSGQRVSPVMRIFTDPQIKPGDVCTVRGSAFVGGFHNYQIVGPQGQHALLPERDLMEL